MRVELTKRKRYPFAAQRMRITGAVAISFVVQPDSTFGNAKIKRSSGHDVLDHAALETVYSLSGEIRRPGDLGQIPLKTSVVLRYQLDF